MPKALVYGTLIVILLAMIPPALVARLRAVNTDQPRVHPVQDMDNQPKFRAQHADPLFADGRAMRPPPAQTLARGQLGEDDHYHRGIVDGSWATTFPARVPVTMALLERGRERYDIYCQPCHGAAGFGDGMINKRAMELVNNPSIGTQTTWVQPKSIHEAQVREQPVGQYYNTVANGVRNMPGYASQITVADRWAIVAYMRALQRSQNARPEDVPADQPLPPPGTGRRGGGEEQR
ncbi:MAG: c-type cytochrome [Planctomycetota bacterium]|jgi:mono/diheme cytochrome c family protein